MKACNYNNQIPFLVTIFLFSQDNHPSCFFDSDFIFTNYYRCIEPKHETFGYV